MPPEYVHKYRCAGVEIMLSESIPNLIGCADAHDEWLNPEEAISNFIKIDSYKRFVEEDCVFLVGRIGTGKTALLNKFKYSVENQEIPNYKSVVLIDTTEYITQLGISVRVNGGDCFSYAETQSLLEQKWEITLNTIAMQNVYTRYRDTCPGKVKQIANYLSEQGLIDRKITIGDLLSQLSRTMSSSENLVHAGMGAVANFLAQFFSANYHNAVDELKEVLCEEGQMAILIDSVELYEFNDKVALAVLNSLVNVCIKYSRLRNGIIVKMAAPSELIPNLRAINIEKIANKIVYIRWSQKELKKLIAVRLYRYLNKIQGTVDMSLALSNFDTYYDEYCMTFDGFHFQTFSYCMTYTQKKPRQMISIYNTWLYLEQRFPNESRMALVRSAITHNETVRVRGALDMYSNIHPEMFELFRRTFTNRKYCFSESEFDRWIKACAGMRNGVSAQDLKRYFISSGLVGILVELHNIPAGTEPFRNKDNIRIKEVLFEYQYKERLVYNKASRFCLHPMCFRVLNCEIDMNTFVYPTPFEIEEEYVPW